MNADLKAEVSLALESFRINEAGYAEMIRGPVVRDLVRRAIRVESAAKRSMGQEEPPSTPGQPPASRSGRLRASITWRPGVDALSPYVDIGSAVVYAAYVELGTSRMAARPYLRPALAAARATI